MEKERAEQNTSLPPVIFTSEEKDPYITKYRYRLKYETPPFELIVSSLLVVVGGLAWLLYFGGMPWEPLIWLAVIPTVIIGGAALRLLVIKLRKWSETK